MRGRILIFHLAVALLLSSSAAADDRELRELLSGLEHKVLLLKQPAAGTQLRFDASGHLLTGSPGKAILDGWLEVTRAKLKKHNLQIQANRLMRGYEPAGKKFIHYRSGTVVIDAVLPARGADAVRELLGNMFADSHADGRVIPDLDEKGKVPGPRGELRTLSNGERVYTVGGDVKALQVITAPDPEYSDEARSAHFSGSLELWAVVDESGVVKYAEIIKPAGYGLEAGALKAISNWKFKPAMLNGQPVPVEIIVEVNFHMG